MKKIIEIELDNEESCDGCPFLKNEYEGNFDDDYYCVGKICGLNYPGLRKFSFEEKGFCSESIKRPENCKNSMQDDIEKMQKAILSIRKPTEGIVAEKLCQLIEYYFRMQK